MNALEERHARLRAAIGTCAADVDREEHFESVLSLIGKHGWQGLKWTRGWAGRKRSTRNAA